jgi:hypothetical protein
MKKKIISMALIGGLAIGFSVPASAQMTFQQVITAIGALIKATGPTGAKYACRKGDITTGTFSFRSFSGMLCTGSLGVVALKICAGWTGTLPNGTPDAFNGSQCDKNARGGLATITPAQVTEAKAGLNELFPGGIP